MTTILFYTPFNQRSRDAESLMLSFQRQGHRVVSLSQQEGFLINDFLKSKGIETYSFALKASRSGWWYYLRHILYFIKFCWKHKVNIVYSHLEPANFVSAIGQYFIKSKVYLCRHHIDEAELYKFNESLAYRITYFLARKIIVVSEHAKLYMTERERIPSSKIIHINLAYDFSLYKQVNEIQVQRLRTKYQTEVLLVAACRFTQFKRPQLAIQVAKTLTQRGLKVKLILLGKGEIFEALEKLIEDENLKDVVYMPGYVPNILDYLAASDFFIHPSILESSCVTVKEAGIVYLPVIACKGIGDFDAYLQHGVNGFLTSKNKFVEEAVEIILNYYQDKEKLIKIGMNLHQTVMSLFNVDVIVKQYNSLNAK